MTLVAITELSPLSQRTADRARLGEVSRRLRARESVLIERVLRELLQPIRDWSVRLMGNPSDAEDVAQEALTAVAGALTRFEGRSSIRTLAHRITVRAAQRGWRRRRKHHADRLGEDPIDARSVGDQVAARDALRRLYRALDTLSPPLRKVFVLCAIEQLTPAEAAEILEVEPGTVRVRLHRAREAVRARLEGA
ncbi:MAG: RNA polymerase sigma factor [Sandaracinaceae bacterium]